MYRITDDNDEPQDPHATPGGYFRLNIWGMGEVRPELEKYGIAKDCPWPQPENYADHEAWIRSNTSEVPGICIYKLCSNDGWVVTPIEVRSGVLWADSEHPGWRKTIDDRALKFVEWMEASPLGFEVW